ncbi:MAG: T9SS type A sorting domain-containing protein [Bacteroidia bacterium]
MLLILGITSFPNLEAFANSESPEIISSALFTPQMPPDTDPPIVQLYTLVEVPVDTSNVINFANPNDLIQSIVEASSYEILYDTIAIDCDDVGQTFTMGVKVRDAFGNEWNGSTTVKPVDITPPVIEFKNKVVVQLDANGEATLTKSNIDLQSYDLCVGNNRSGSGLVYNISRTSFDCTDLPTAQVTVTVVDGSGNSESDSYTKSVVSNQLVYVKNDVIDEYSVTVNIDDCLPPVALCDDIEVTVGSNGFASISPADVDLGSYDNCTGVWYSTLTDSVFTCADAGTKKVSLSVYDFAGNMACCPVEVTVNFQDEKPTVICQDITVQLDANGEAEITAADIDGGSFDDCGIETMTIDKTSFTCSDIGDNFVTLTVCDNQGQCSECTATVKVISTNGVDLDIDVNNISCFGANDGSISISATGLSLTCDGFRTQTQGGWGTSCNGNNPGCYRDANFVTAFPSGLTIGCTGGNSATFTTSSAIQSFLPAGGSPGALSSNAINATSTSAGVLAGQLVALSLSVGFDAADPSFGSSPASLSNLKIIANGSPFDGMTVGEFLVIANEVIGGCNTSYSFSDVNDIASMINENFVDGTTNKGDLEIPSSFVWSNGATSNEITDLGPGNYSVTVTNCGISDCPIVKTFTISEPTELTATIEKTDATCDGEELVACSVSRYNSSSHAIWLPNLANGVSNKFWFENGAGSFVQYPDGTAHLTGEIYNANDAGKRFDVSVWFYNKRDWAQWSALGRGVKGNSGTINGNNVDWTFYEMDPNKQNTLTGKSDYLGDVLYLTHKPANLNYAFQIGVAANDKDADYGMSGWFNYTGSWSGHGDFNFDASCTTFEACDGIATVSVSGGTAPYSYSWSNGANSETAEFLCAGTYSVTITDANGCTTTQTDIVINEPSGCNVTDGGSIDGGQANCGSFDPVQFTSITSPSGGLGALEYKWMSSTVSATYTAGDNNWIEISNSNSEDLDLGLISQTTYVVRLSRRAGNTDYTGVSNVITLTVYPIPSVSITKNNDITCFGAGDGSATVNVSSGTAPYSYSWSSGSTTADADNLTAGTYTVTVTDANGCSATEQVIITEPTELTATVTSTNPTCNGGNDGAGTCAASGGTAPYAYAWSNGNNTANAQNLTAGTYNVAVTDANGCSVTKTVIITEPSDINVSVVSSDVTCGGTVVKTCTVSRYNNNSHAIWLPNLPNGVSNKFWFTNNAGTLTQYPDGTAHLTGEIYNASDAGKRFEVSVWFYNKRDWAQWNALGRSIKGNTNTINGNNVDWTFYEMDPNKQNTLTGLSDYQGDVLNLTHKPSNLNFAFQIGVGANDKDGDFGMSGWFNYTGSWSGHGDFNFDASCSDDSQCDGSAVATASGGTSPYTYSWSNGGNTNTIDELCEGTYTVTVTDANGCIKTETVTISAPAALTASINANDPDCSAGNNGSASVSVTGGTSPYTYSWSNGAAATSISGLNAGMYSVTVTDAKGCQTIVSTTLTLPSCCNVTNGGTISGNQSNCGPFDPNPITSLTLPSGGLGGVEYVWLQSNTLVPNTVGNPYWTEVPNSNSETFDPGLITETTYYIRCSRSIGCTFYAGESNVITITVNAAPSISITKNNDITCFGAGDGSATVNVSSGTAPYSYSWSSGSNSADADNLNAGTYTVTVTDANGCSATEQVTITEPSQLVATTSSVDGSCLNANDGSATVSVSGGTSPYSYDWSNGATTATINNVVAGTYSVLVTDANGCATTKSVVVDFDDNVAPVANCKNITVQLSSNGTATIVAADVNNGSTDNCGIGSMTVSPASFDCSNVGSNTVTLTVTDVNGNTATCQSTVTVEDNVAPSVLCKTAVVYLDASGKAQVTVSDVDNGSSDACGIDAMSVSPTQFDCSHVGTPQSVVLSVTDIYGNTSTCTTTVSVEDNLDPVANCKNVTVVLDANGNASIAASDINDGSTDNCGIANLSLSQKDFDCSHIGNNSITLTVEDVNGNISTCASTITVVDDEDPTISGVPATVTVTANANDCTPSVSWTPPTANDNCTVSLTSNYNQGDDFPIGSTTVTYTAEDGSGNTATASFNVVVNASPIVVNVNTSDVSCNGGADGSATTTVSGGCEPYSYLWSTNSTSTSISGLSAGNYSITITDANGNSKSVNFTVGEASKLVATVSGSDPTCATGTDGSATVNVSGGTSPYSYTWSNNATTSSISGLSSGTYSVTITDANGCTTTGSVSIARPLCCNVTSGGTIGNGQENCGPFNPAAITNTISPSGGLGALEYLWLQSNVNVPNTVGNSAWSPIPNSNAATYDPGQITQTTYYIRCARRVGCTDWIGESNIIAMIVNPVPTVSLQAPATVCTGGNDGTIDLTVGSGTAPFTYAWTKNGLPFDNTEDLTNLDGGIYEVTVTDAKGCSATGSVTIGIQDAFDLEAVIDDVNCFGGNTGEIDLSINGSSTNTSTMTIDEDIWVEDFEDLALCVSNDNGSTAWSVSGYATGYAQVKSISGSKAFDMNNTDNTITWKSESIDISNHTDVEISAKLYDYGNLESGDFIKVYYQIDGGNEVALTNGIHHDDFGCETATATGLSGNSIKLIIYTKNSSSSEYHWFDDVTVSGSRTVTYTTSDVWVETFEDNSLYATSDNGTTAWHSWKNSSSNYAKVKSNNAGKVFQMSDGDAKWYSEKIDISNMANVSVDIELGSVQGNELDASGSYVDWIRVYYRLDNGSWEFFDTNYDTKGELSSNNIHATVAGLNGDDLELKVWAHSTTTSEYYFVDNVTVTANTPGNSSNYTILWSNNETTEDITDLTAGNYTVTVTDVNGCSVTKQFVVTQPNELELNANVAKVSCPSTPAQPICEDGIKALEILFTGANGTDVVVKDANGITLGSFVNVDNGDILSVTSSSAIQGPIELCTPSCAGKQNGQNIAQGCQPSVNATFSCNNESVYVCSSKDLSNVVLKFSDGTEYKFDNLSVGKCHTFSGNGSNAGKEIVGVWIKSGCNSSNDGPGYGEYVRNANSATCQSISLDCTNGIIGASSSDFEIVSFVDVNGVSSVNQTPNSICELGLSGLSHGELITGQFVSEGTTVSAVANGGHLNELIVFNTNETNTSDPDLEVNIGNILIFPENNTDNNNDGIYDDPDDQAQGGTITFNYSSPRAITSLKFVDSENSNGWIKCYDASNNIIINKSIANAGDASVQDITLNAFGVSKMVVYFTTSGGIGDIKYDCAQDVCDGAIDLSVIGGTAPYSYTWNNGETTQDISELCEGTYTVTVADANGCSKEIQVVVEREACCNVTDAGKITGNQNSCGAYTPSQIEDLTSATGGAGNLEYEWYYSTSSNTYNSTDNSWNKFDGETSATLQPGLVSETTYIVRLAKRENCSDWLASNVISLIVKDAPTVSINEIVASTCQGGLPTIEGTIGGSYTSYHWLFNGNRTTFSGTTISDAALGVYTLVVTNASGCEVTADYTSAAPVGPSVSADITNSLAQTSSNCDCEGRMRNFTVVYQGNGKDVTVRLYNKKKKSIKKIFNKVNNGDVLSFDGYDKSNRHEAYVHLRVGSGSFTEIHTSCSIDILGNTYGDFYVQSYVDGDGNSCSVNSVCTGDIDVTVNTGIAPYTYSWSNGETTQDLTDVCPGNYTLTITDANGCYSQETFTVGTTSASSTRSTVANKETATSGEINNMNDQFINASELSISPNPTNGFAKVNFIINESANANVFISDMAGKQLLNVYDGFTEGGVSQQVSVDLTQLRSGIYMVVIRTSSGESMVQRVVVSR